MLSSGRGFAKVGALYASIECDIRVESVRSNPSNTRLAAPLIWEKYRAKNDIYNSIGSCFVAGGVLARNSGSKAALAGGVGFAIFSAAIDLFMRRETPE